jgi:hypothetical protein
VFELTGVDVVLAGVTLFVELFQPAAPVLGVPAGIGDAVPIDAGVVVRC